MNDILKRQDRILPRPMMPRDLWIVIGAAFAAGVILTAVLVFGFEAGSIAGCVP